MSPEQGREAHRSLKDPSSQGTLEAQGGLPRRSCTAFKQDSWDAEAGRGLASTEQKRQQVKLPGLGMWGHSSVLRLLMNPGGPRPSEYFQQKPQCWVFNYTQCDDSSWTAGRRDSFCYLICQQHRAELPDHTFWHSCPGSRAPAAQNGVLRSPARSAESIRGHRSISASPAPSVPAAAFQRLMRTRCSSV